MAKIELKIIIDTQDNDLTMSSNGISNRSDNDDETTNQTSDGRIKPPGELPNYHFQNGHDGLKSSGGQQDATTAQTSDGRVRPTKELPDTTVA